MIDREKVIAWLTEISLRPCDFTRDDFDAYETERLANDAIEIVEDAEIFCKQRNDALALLKEQEAVKPVLDEQTGRIWLCGKCGSFVGFEDNDPDDPNEFLKFCHECGRPVLWEGR